MSVRMVALGKKSIRKKKSLRLTGIPITLNYKTQITAGLALFKKSLGLARQKKIEYDIKLNKFVKKKGIKKEFTFKKVLFDEMINFYFFGLLRGYKLKSDLYSKVLKYKKNGHFR